MNPDLREALSHARSRVDRDLADFRAYRGAVKRERAALNDSRTRLEAAGQARDIARAVGESIQRQAHRHVGDLVSRCLKAVFGEDGYEFRIVLEKRRNRTEARAVFLRDGNEIDPLSAAGGGTVDVAAFALRLAVVLMRHPKPRRLLVLDEPMKYLSAEYRPRVRTLIEKLAEELGFQIIMVTHSDDLECGKIVRIG